MAKSNNNAEKTPEQKLQEQIKADQAYVIKNKRIRRQTRRRAIIIILLVFLLIIALLTSATYAIMRFVDESNFRVTVTQTGTSWLSLSKDPTFAQPKSVLDITAPKNMDNCTLCGYLDEKLTEMVSTDDSFSGSGSDVIYIVSTFYLKNAGDYDVTYNEKITLERVMRGMDKAVRVVLIKDDNLEDDSYGSIVAYGAYASDENGDNLLDADGNPIREEVVPDVDYIPAVNNSYKGFTFDETDFDENGVWLCKPFAGDGYIHNSELFPLKCGEIIKYTVLIWLEGQDPQCVGNNDSLVDAERGILGGQVKISVEFTASTTSD